MVNTDALVVMLVSYDGENACESIDLCLMNKLTNIIDQNKIGLHKDDSLAIG